MCLLLHFLIFWESFSSEKRVIKEITSLNLFTCAYQVFINNNPGGCIPQLDAGSLIGIRSHLEIHDYIRGKKEFVADIHDSKWDFGEKSYSLVVEDKGKLTIFGAEDLKGYSI